MNDTRLVERETFPVIVVFAFIVRIGTKSPFKHHAGHDASSPSVARFRVEVVQQAVVSCGHCQHMQQVVVENAGVDAW